jgi:hypothetical protein
VPTTEDGFGSGDRWLLIVDVPPLEDQVESDPEYVWPNDMATKIATYVARYWSLLPEEISEQIRWTDTRVEISSDILDALMDPLHYIMFHTIPYRFHLTRVGRSDGTWDVWHEPTSERKRR